VPAALIVAAAFPPSGGGGVMRMAKLAKYLPRSGWGVTVLCAEIRHPEIADPGLAAEIPEGVHVVRVASPLSVVVDRAAGSAVAEYRAPGARRGVGAAIRVGRALLVPDRWVLWSLRAGTTTVTDRPDVVISSGPPHSVHLAGGRLAARFDVPHVVDLRDAWAEGAFGLRVAPWQGWIDRSLERRTLRRADAIVVAVREYVEAIRARYPELRAPVRAIRNGYDEADVAGVPHRRVPGPSDPIEFLYPGRLVGSQRIGTFLEALESLVSGGELAANLRFLGQIDPPHAAEARRRLGDAVRFDRPVPHAEAIAAMAAADVLVVVTVGGGMGSATLTGKIFECLALGRPVLLIGPRGPAVDLLASTGGGAWADPDDPGAVRRAILEVVAMARDPGFAGAGVDQLAPYTRSHLATEWAEVLADTIHSRRSSA
jgi:glycosyltransferase involved in cell wall biosynthesis